MGRMCVGKLVDHPFLVGLAVSILLAVAVRMLATGTLAPGSARGIGLVVYGGTLVLLARFGLDREDVFWFFLGGVSGVLLSLPLTL